MIDRLVSGGQTGVDRAAFDVALELDVPMGGWVPLGRIDENGFIPDRYPGLRETDSAEPAVRTERNVRDSDATLLVSHGELAGGSALTVQACGRLGRPVLHVDLGLQSADEAARRIRRWIADLDPRVLNVAGPRHSEDPTVYDAACEVLRLALGPAVGLRESAIEGTGVFAARHFEAGDVISRIHVQREITAESPLAPGECYQHQSYPDGRVVLVGAPDRHVNHCCDPNAYKRFHAFDRAYTIARRTIAKKSGCSLPRTRS